MDQGHYPYAAPQSLPQQPTQAAASHLYSSSYYTVNANTYPNQIVGQDHPSSAAVALTSGAVVPASEHYALQSGYDGQSTVAFGGYQPDQHAASYTFGLQQAVALTSYYQQAKRHFKVKPTILDLEEKKQKIIEGGAPANSVRVCTLCNVVCNSDKVFSSHLAGEKHLLKALGRTHAMVPKVMAHMRKANKIKASKKTAVIGTSRAPTFVHSLVCEVCKIECNSQEALNSHKMGKKHKGKLQKLKEAIAPKPAATSASNNLPPVTSQTTNEDITKKKPKEDLETKKEKVVKGGAAEAAVKVCMLCNVVCNSETVYNFHITGKKHLAMTKKQVA